jgi:hypothetical protein
MGEEAFKNNNYEEALQHLTMILNILQKLLDETLKMSVGMRSKNKRV